MTVARPVKIKPVRLWLPWLHPAQAEFVNDQSRFVVAACGTKTGKTFGLANWIVQQAWNREQALVWWCAPTYKQAQIAFKHIGLLLPPGRYRKRSSAGEMVYELLYTDGRVRSIIDFRSAERPESLRGEGVHAAVIDEAGYWKLDSYVSVMTTLTRTAGKLRIISTPKGRNWFFDIWSQGWCFRCKMSKQKCPCTDNKKVETSLGQLVPLQYSSYQLPTSANPVVPRAAIEEARRILTEKQFQQEYLAEFLPDGAGVFTNVVKCQKCKLLEAPLPGRRYVLAIDWAKQEDYTVLTVMDLDTRKVVYIDRFTGLDWNVSIDKAIRCAKFWNRAAVIMDANNMGDTILDQFKAVYPMAEGYVFTSASKTALVQRLQLALERQEIQLPVTQGNTEPYQDELAKTLESELMTFSSTITKTGRFQFSAPEGYYDDMVISLALATAKVLEDPLVYRFDQVSM